jgi:UDP-N-acetylglucosamine acyltransferase
MPSIHPTAIVDPACQLADDAVIGPYSILSGAVTLGPGARLIGSNYLQGPVSIGARTILYPFACIGYAPQDYKFGPGSVTAGVVIGRDCLIREHATVHASTKPDVPTRVGDRVFLMCSTHVAHDARVGDRVVMVNGSGIAGHGEISDDVTLGGNAVIHQFCRIGRMVMMSGDCAVNLDVPPFCVVSERNRIGGLNLVGLRRAGVPREQITALRRAFSDLLYTPMPREQLVSQLRERGGDGACPPMMEMAEFIAGSKRGITPGFGKPARGAAESIEE